jgi:sugar lactone lactonase YvrE
MTAAAIIATCTLTLALAACGTTKPKHPDGGPDGGDATGQAGTSGAAGTGAAGTGGAGTSGAAGDTGDGGTDDAVDAEPADVPPRDDAAAGQVFTCSTEAPDAGAATVKADDVKFMLNVNVSTIAGSDMRGSMDGTAAEARFANPVSVIIEPSGDLVVCDFDNNALRRISTPNGTATVSTLTKQANFQRPYGMLLIGGMLYVDTDYNHNGSKSNITGTIWQIDGATGMASVVGPNLGRPRGLAALNDGRIVLGDYQNGRIRILDPATSTVSDLAGNPGCHGFGDGKGTSAYFGVPYGVAVMPSGLIMVADASNHRIRAVTTEGVVTTYAGDGGEGTIDATRLQARFVWPSGLAVDAAGQLFVTDQKTHRIRRIAVDGTVTTVAGDGTGGHRDGPGDQARFFGVEGIAVTADGKTLYVADGSQGEDVNAYHYIRKIVIGP